MNKLLKTLIAGVSSLTMCVSAMPLCASATTTSYKQGDVNGDGIVNSVDVLLCKRFLNGLSSATNGVTAERVDVNQDGVIDQNDLTIVKNINLGTVNTTTIPSNYTTNLPQRESRKYCVFNTNGTQTTTYWLYKNDAPEITSSSTSTCSIIDSGVSDTRVPENGLKGVVRLTSSAGTGTGFIVDDHTILTAGHCLYDEDNHKGVSNLQIHFYDDYNVEDTSVTATPISYQIPYGYVRNYDSDTTNNLGSSSNYDYALITVEEDLSEYINFNVGVLRDDVTSIQPDMRLYVTGFGSSNDKEINSNKSTGVGSITSIGNYMIGHNVDTKAGDSGAPIYTYINNKKIVVGIHAYSGNSAIRFTTDVLQFIYQHE